MSKILTFDVEATGALRNKAKPNDPRNRCVLNSYRIYDFSSKSETLLNNDTMEYDLSNNYLDEVQKFQDAANQCDMIIGMNIKYDMNWMRRYGISFRGKRLWDIQSYHSATNGQMALPSLNDIATHWNLPVKLDIVKTQYWEQGKDTDEVPLDILIEYGSHDVWLTQQISLLQFKHFRSLTKNLQETIKIKMKDLGILFEMEWNGFKYDVEESKEHAKEVQARITAVVDSLNDLVFGDEDRISINYGSYIQRSCILYGGVLKYEEKEEYWFHYANPKKQPVIKTRKVIKERVFPRLCEPPKNSETESGKSFASNEAILKKIKTKDKKVKEIVKLFLELANLNKLVNTYLLGLPEKIEEFGWFNDNIIHGDGLARDHRVRHF